MGVTTWYNKSLTLHCRLQCLIKSPFKQFTMGGGANGIKWRKWRITHGFFHFLHRKSLHFIPFYPILCHWKIEKSGISRKLIFDKVSISKNKLFYLLWFYILVSTNLNEQYSGRAAVGQMSPNHTFLWRKWKSPWVILHLCRFMPWIIELRMWQLTWRL